MGLRFRKSIKIAPGVKLNIGKKSVGLSVGGKYGGVSVNSKTGARVRASAPGTGLSYSEKIGKSSTRSRQNYHAVDDESVELTPLEQEEMDIQQLELNLKWIRILIPPICMMLLLLASAVYPILFAVVIGICVWWEKWRKKAAHDLAVAKYRENCLKYDLKINDPPTDEDISPYRIKEIYVDKKHRIRKKKQFFQRGWFIAWAIFCVWGAIVTR